MAPVTLAELERLRVTRGATILLHVTDRCPVGCGHCNVDARPDSSRVSDRGLFAAVVEGVARHPTAGVVGVTGGEPFVERWALSYAAARFAAAGKRSVLYTSGVWARDGVPTWCRDVFAAASTVVLSTDGFHAARVDETALRTVLDLAVDTDTWPIVQTVDTGGAGAAAVGLLRQHLGHAWRERADLSVIPLLPEGRGTGHPDLRDTRTAGRAVGRCRTAWSPTVRYDGHVQPCCNTGLLAGRGPAALRSHAADAEAVVAHLDTWWDDPVLGVLAGTGVAPLLEHPDLQDLRDRSFVSGCDACWALHDRLEDAPRSTHAFVEALAGVTGTVAGRQR